jgi:hypothetical protein
MRLSHSPKITQITSHHANLTMLFMQSKAKSLNNKSIDVNGVGFPVILNHQHNRLRDTYYAKSLQGGNDDEGNSRSCEKNSNILPCVKIVLPCVKSVLACMACVKKSPLCIIIRLLLIKNNSYVMGDIAVERGVNCELDRLWLRGYEEVYWDLE